jgi:UPF0755 protein
LSRNRRFVLLAAALILGALVGAGGWWLSSGQPVGAGSAVRVTVPKGATPTTLGRELEAKGILRSAQAFALRARGAVIQPGVYDLSPRESPARILDRLVRGDVVTQRVTFPEGWTLAQIARRLDQRGLVDEAAFLDLVTRRGNTLRASFPPPANLEGYLFPDTYEFPVGASAEDIAQQMLTNFDRRVAQGRADAIKRSGRALSEIVTIASLIEREAEVPEDRSLIAGVIYNRLEREMPLQIDATVQYARGVHTARLLYRDLEIDSPYNTYRIPGLPPGPIANPGMASIEAALSPRKSDYLYYVARADGSHVFGRTLAEHNHNIARVRRGQGG